MNGFHIEGDSTSLEKNSATGNRGDGVHIDTTADSTEVSGNNASYNESDGIDDESTNTTGSGNTTIGNGGTQCDSPNATLCPS